MLGGQATKFWKMLPSDFKYLVHITGALTKNILVSNKSLIGFLKSSPFLVRSTASASREAISGMLVGYRITCVTLNTALPPNRVSLKRGMGNLETGNKEMCMCMCLSLCAGQSSNDCTQWKKLM